MIILERGDSMTTKREREIRMEGTCLSCLRGRKVKVGEMSSPWFDNVFSLLSLFACTIA